ncbi:MAG TPA: patatin-like phospholipase family protein [Dongiaceae bacterium]|nr:patatin-like phospholipase family protein [Dongiaceae bacterium]
MTDGARRRPLSLVLCGGGITGAMYEFGALHALDHFLVDGFRVTDFDIFVGTSAGAVVAALLANGVAPQAVGRAIRDAAESPLNFRQEDVVQLDGDDVRASLRRVLGIVPEWLGLRRGKPRLSLPKAVRAIEETLPAGIYSLEPYRAYLKRLLASPGCTDSFAALKCELYIPAVTLDKAELVLFGAEPFRDVPISDAIAASSALPLYFRPVTLDGIDYVDGGVGQVVHFDRPLLRGSRFLILVNPVIPIHNDPAEVCIPTRTGHCARLQEKGVSFVIDQSQRISSRQRMILGLERFRHLYPDARILLIEPPPRDSVLFLENILNYSARVAMLDYGYRSTAQLLRARFQEFQEAFAANGVEVTLERLRDENPWAPEPVPAHGAA